MNKIIVSLGIYAFHLHFYVMLAIVAVVNALRSLYTTFNSPHNKKQPIDPYQKTNPQVFEDTDKIIQHEGFSLQTHRFQTVDGCEMVLWRIFKKDTKLTKLYPILLMHGLLDCSISWFLQKDKSKCLPYMLASQGYDVWIGNNRGNKISLKQQHQHNDHQFWNYTLDQLVEYDQPTIINGILAATNKEKLIYVGHSQGSTQFLLGLGVHHELQDKIASFIGLGTVVSLQNVKSHLILKVLSKLHLLQFCKFLKLNKILLIPRAISKKVGVLIDNSKVHFQVMMGFISLLCGFSNNSNIPKDLFGVIITHEPGGASTNNTLHWVQCYRYGGIIRKFCYGKQKNADLYGSEQPPSYCLQHLKSLKFNSHLFKGLKDSVMSNDDFTNLLTKFDVDKVSAYQIADYNHLDYLWSNSAHQDYYPTIMEIVDKTSQN